MSSLFSRAGVMFCACGFLLLSGCGRIVPPDPQDIPKHTPAASPSPEIPSSTPSSAGEASVLRKDIPLTGYVPPAISLAEDSEFFSALDLDYPGLEKVKAAVGSGDYAAARAALVGYYRSRTTPHLVVDGKEVQPVGAAGGGNRLLAADSMAGQALSHDYVIAGIRHKFDGPINWELNPTTQPGYKGAWSGQFHTQLNRMHYWRELAEAWRTTGNPVYRRELLAQMADWQKTIRPPALDEIPGFIKRYLNGGGNVRQFKLWQPLDTGQRAANTVHVFEALRQDPAFGEDAMIAALKMLGEHARVLSQLQIDGNHLAIATMGLARVGVLFPEFREAHDWTRESVARVGVELNKQVYPDGAQMELTPWYHFTALRSFAGVLEVAAANGTTIPPDILEGLGRMYRYIAEIADPLGAAPPLNDSEWLRTSCLRQARIFFPGDPVYKWFGSEGAEGAPPDFLSTIVPYAGQAVMRSGWDKDALYLLMEYGPFGTGHMHEDKLGLSVAAYGQRILVDSARGKYEASVWRDYGVNAGAHSTVLFDGLFQARRLHHKQLGRVSEPVPVPWKSTQTYDYVRGEYGVDELETFALPTDPPGNVAPEWAKIVLDEPLRQDDVQITKRMAQRRHVVFVKPFYWVIVDTFDPMDDAPHSYTSLYQFAPGKAAVAGQAVEFRGADGVGATLAASFSAARPESVSFALAEGQKTPCLLGWRFENGEPLPAPTAIVRHSATGRNASACVLVPHRKGEPASAPAITWLDAPDGGYRIHVVPGGGMPEARVDIPAGDAAPAMIAVGPGAN